MVRKFVLIRTNKEDDTKEYPAYVMHYTDFSPNRKAPLDREVFISDSKGQIESLYAMCKEENVKKGWAPYGAVTEETETPKKKPAKKKAAKRTTKAEAKTTTKKKTAKKKKPAKKPKPK